MITYRGWQIDYNENRYHIRGVKGNFITLNACVDVINYVVDVINQIHRDIESTITYLRFTEAMIQQIKFASE